MNADRGNNLRRGDGRARERGYALVALLALMTVLAISMMAAAPSMRQQSRRELEKEAIARGEEVAEAIRRWIHVKGTPPTSMDELIEGVPVGVKKVQLLRASAARDPLTKDGTWRTIKPTDQELRDFSVALTRYANVQRIPTNDRHPAMVTLAATLPQPVGGLVNLDDDEEEEDAPCDEKASDTSRGPFVGVASRSRCASVINYYGIGRHDKWVFTPFYR